MRGDFDAGGIEQRDRRGDEDDGDQVAGQIRQRVPGIAAEFLRVPGQHESERRRRLEGPARSLRLGQRDAGQPERDMRGDDAADQNGRQRERISRTVPGQIKHQRHGAGRRQSVQRLRIGEPAERGKLETHAGDDADGADTIRQPVAPRNPPTTG